MIPMWHILMLMQNTITQCLPGPFTKFKRVRSKSNEQPSEALNDCFKAKAIEPKRVGMKSPN